MHADVVDTGDVLTLYLAGRLGFACESLRDARPGQELPVKELERDGFVEMHVLGGDHVAHAADAQEALDLILAGDHVALAHGNVFERVH